MATHIDLSHSITDGMVTYPGLPAPTIGDHLTREAAEEIYGPGLTFQIGMVHLCTNTGTYIDVPFHRYADGHDLTALALERVASVDAVKIVACDREVVDLSADDLQAVAGAAGGLRGKAVLVETGHARHWGTDAYFENHPALTAKTAELLVGEQVACVGIDSLNIDATSTGDRPVHSILLGADIPIIEHLRGLEALPESGFQFSAVPPKIEGAGTFTVRAFASIG